MRIRDKTIIICQSTRLKSDSRYEMFFLSFVYIIKICFLLDEIRRTLGEGTFGKVVEVRDLRG